MFPWTDGFRWTVNHIVFLSLFFAVVLTIVTTVVSAARRAAHDLHKHSAADICWKSDFAELPEYQNWGFAGHPRNFTEDEFVGHHIAEDGDGNLGKRVYDFLQSVDFNAMLAHRSWE